MVEVTKGGAFLAELKQGAYFGEMALVEKNMTIRNASAQCMTAVSVGILSIEDFKMIDSFPVFREKIE